MEPVSRGTGGKLRPRRKTKHVAWLTGRRAGLDLGHHPKGVLLLTPLLCGMSLPEYRRNRQGPGTDRAQVRGTCQRKQARDGKVQKVKGLGVDL